MRLVYFYRFRTIALFSFLLPVEWCDEPHENEIPMTHIIESNKIMRNIFLIDLFIIKLVPYYKLIPKLI